MGKLEQIKDINNRLIAKVDVLLIILKCGIENVKNDNDREFKEKQSRGG